MGDAGRQAEDAIIRRFSRGLDNRYFMLRGMRFEGAVEPFPPILIGPPGLFVLNLSQAKGIFRAREASWWQINKKNHQFSPAQPNLIKQTQEKAQKLTEILDTHGRSHPEVVPILIFANPGVDVETNNPAIRIVRMDGVETLIANFLNTHEIFPLNEIIGLSDALEVMANPEKAIPLGEGEDFFGKDLYVPDKKAPPKIPPIPIPKEMPLPPVEKKLQFSKKQWIILAVLLSLTILVLLGAIIYALSSA